MMQSRRPEHGSSGELDVFGATNYFAALPPAAPDDDCPSSMTEPSISADRLYFHAKMQRDMTKMTTEDNSFRGPAQQQQQIAGLHDHAERHASNKQLQVVAAAKRLPSSGKSKSKLAAILSFIVSPSPRASFRKEINYKEAPSTTRLRLQAETAASAAAGDDEREPASDTCYKATAASSSSSRESSMQLQGLFGAHDDDDDELDLGVATGDRRLQGITVVRGISDVERWVVRCVPGGAWDDEERREKMLDAAESASSEQNIKDELVEVEQAGDDDDDGDSDSSSDLFDLDLEYR